jgi:hypothetical protein
MIPQDKFYITHSTSILNVESILEARSIQPLTLKKNYMKKSIKRK